jgi:single-stranded DNA-binding protein
MLSFTASGKLFQDARLVDQGKGFLSFSVASRDPFDREKQVYLQIKVYGEKRIETLSKILRKGAVVAVVGKIRPWQSGEGDARKYGVDFIADDVNMIVWPERDAETASAEAGEESQVPASTEDEFPF